MINQELLEHITQQLQQGVARGVIVSDLLAQGWQQSDIDAVFMHLLDNDFLLSKDHSHGGKRVVSKNSKRAVRGFLLSVAGNSTWLAPVAYWPLLTIGCIAAILGLILCIKGLSSSRRRIAILGIILSSLALLATVGNIYRVDNGSVEEGNNTNEPVSSSVTDGQLQQEAIAPAVALNDDRAEFIDQVVQEVKAQLSFPHVVDDVTTMIDVTSEPGAIRYHYVLSGVDTDKLSNELLRGGLFKQICSNEDIKNLLNEGVNTEYSYSVEDSTQTYFVSFTRADCQ